jgi:Outer membrane protein beta-barrel family/CarboxypepD_reg-like domain
MLKKQFTKLLNQQKMKRLHSLLAMLFISTSFLFAQNPNKVTLKGMVQDTSGVDQPFATVMLLNPKDSALINFTRGDDKGYFEFKNVKNTDYVLKISFVGYIPYQLSIAPSANAVNDLGGLKMKPITKELMEVVIRTAKAPLSIRGDTIEYNASSFKVPQGSTVEDLLRRLPGIEVDAAGNIKAQGKDVKKLYVDGKSFFGDDPKAATKNLDAETISKVQVFTEKSEQSKLTGVDDGKKEKAMNLELKEEFKKGSFGKVTAAGGNDERWALRGNYNRFNKTAQFSVLGYGNNINETGVNWADYGEFKGQNSWNGQDNGDFGFSSGGGGMMFFNNNDEDVPRNRFDGRGFTKNFGSGVNYNFDNKKTKVNSSYFYNQTRLNLDELSFRQTFFQGTSFSNNDTSQLTDFRNNHNVLARLEQEIDSNNTVIVKANLRFSGNDVVENNSQFFFQNPQTPTNRLGLSNDNNLNSHNLTSYAIFRHRFKKKGRSVAISTSYNDVKSNAIENIRINNRIFTGLTLKDSISRLDNDNDRINRQIKSSLLYTDALSKSVFWETFYNFSNTNNNVNRQVKNLQINNERVDTLSVFYKNNILYNRLGTSFRYSKDGMNLSAGVAAQQINLLGQSFADENKPLLKEVKPEAFNNFIPNISINIEPKNNMYVGFDYNYGVKAPDINDLQPINNLNNPAFRVVGNAGLVPERSHNVSMNFNYFNPGNFSYAGFWASANFYDNQIIYNQNLQVAETGIVMITRPENLKNGGGQMINSNVWMGFPIVKTKLTMNINGGINYNFSPSFIDGQRNDTRNMGYNGNLSFDLTPDPKIIVNLGIGINLNNIKYSIQTQQNQTILNNAVDLSVKWNFIPKYFLETNLDYNAYKNDRFDFDQKIPIWNASIRRLLGKTNRFEVRLAVFDLLNQRQAIRQNGSQNYISRTISQTLARYGMLSVTYNLRGHEDKLKKNGWM